MRHDVTDAIKLATHVAVSHICVDSFVNGKPTRMVVA